jgi:hypothetical protein
MAKSSVSSEKVKVRSRHALVPPVVGRHAIGYETEETTRAKAAAWRELKEENDANDEKIDYLKGQYERGLRRLVREGYYHSQVLDCLPTVAMIPLAYGNEDPNLEKLYGYLSSGTYQERINDPRVGNLRGDRSNFVAKDTQGLYIAAADLDNAAVVIHEAGHLGVKIGDPHKFHVLREPIVNQEARDIMLAVNMDATFLDTAYQPHERVLGKIIAASSLSVLDVTRLTSGPDPVKNDYEFRRLAAEGAGWDIVGFAQGQYIKNLNLNDLGPGEIPDLYQAAWTVDHLLEDELHYR